jgi:hypothetical protein
MSCAERAAQPPAPATNGQDVASELGAYAELCSPPGELEYDPVEDKVRCHFCGG